MGPTKKFEVANVRDTGRFFKTVNVQGTSENVRDNESSR